MAKLKYLISIERRIVEELQPYLRNGVSIQELLRARIIPEWMDGPALVAKKFYKKGYRAGRRNESFPDKKQP